MSESFMARLGARLVDNGYPILPIMPGTKKPGQYTASAWHDYPGWTRHGERPTTEGCKNNDKPWWYLPKY